MQTSADILSNINISFLLIAILTLVVIILFVHSCYMRRNLHECHRVIVRLLNEKEDLRQHLPTELRFKYYPDHLSRPEIISIINMVKKLLLVFCIAGYLLPLNAQKSEPRFALSTNLLPWATLAPNVGTEFYVGKNWSVAADGSFGMWGCSHMQRVTQTWSAGGEVSRIDRLARQLDYRIPTKNR